MKRFYSVRSKKLGVQRPIPSVRFQTAGTDTAYEPYRPLDGAADMPYQSSPPSARGRKSSSRGSKILRIVSCVVAIILAAGIISMTARIIEILESTKDARLMWPYGMMLKAWPPGGMLAVSTYLMLVASSMAVVVNSVLLMMLCIRRGDNGTSVFGSLFTLVVRTITTAALVTAVILDAVAHPNLRSWSCISKEFEHDFRDNEIGFEHVCFDLTAGFAATIGLAVIELLNVAVAMWSRIQRRRYQQVRPQFMSQPKGYDKLDKSVQEDDEIPMLDVDRRGQMS